MQTPEQSDAFLSYPPDRPRLLPLSSYPPLLDSTVFPILPLPQPRFSHHRLVTPVRLFTQSHCACQFGNCKCFATVPYFLRSLFPVVLGPHLAPRRNTSPSIGSDHPLILFSSYFQLEPCPPKLSFLFSTELEVVLPGEPTFEFPS